MPLPTNLTTNEVKDASGVEVEFLFLDKQGRKLVFAKNGETPSQQYRLTVQHQEIGTGIDARRRSNCRIDKNIVSAVDGASIKPITVSTTIDIPIGHLLTLDEAKAVMANMMSFLATTGAATTVLFDCTGYGAAALVNGSL